MPIELFWDDDQQTVILCQFSGAWTWDDLYDMFRKIQKVGERKSHHLAAIVDFRGGFSVPGGSIPSAFANANRIFRMTGEAVGPVAIVGAPGFLKRVYDSVTGLQAERLRVFFVGSLDEARAVLNRQRLKS